MKWKVSNNERPIKEGFYYTVDSIGCKSVTEFARNHWYSSTGHPVVEWLDESPSGSEAWVSVEDRLPEYEKPVIVCGKFGSKYLVFQDTAFYNKSGWYDNSNGLKFAAITVTHWQPLPQPPIK